MSISTRLEFPNDEADESEGLGDAGIETYKDAIYASIARETGQNSADVGAIKPVKMSFDVIEIDRNELPSLEKFVDTINICLNQATKEKDGKGIDFFKRAKEVLIAGKIKILRVADYNTKGLAGPSKRGTPFYSLLKGSGISLKESDTSGGSFGIGKNAAFAVSELQTVFYSSQYPSDGSLQFIAQGKTILVSHIDESGKHKKGKGYWGLPDFKEVSDISHVPEWLRRREQGTSIFSIAFRSLPNWPYKMAASLVSNFFCAIQRGEMEFSVDNGRILINKETLASLFEMPEIRQAAEENNSLENFDFSRSLYACLISAHTKEKIFQHNTLGKISCKILVSDDLPKKLALIRNGMIIADSLEYFGDKFARFPMAKEFVALVEAQEDVGNAMIKTLENPRHDGLSAERLHDPKKSREANIAIKQLIKLIREAIKEETTTIPDDEITVDELTEFFADDSIHEKSDDPEHEDNIETFVYKASERPPRPRHRTTGHAGTDARHRRGHNAKEPGHESGRGEETSNRGNSNQFTGSSETYVPGNFEEILELDISDVRNIFVESDKKLFRRIFFTSPLTCQARISIEATGINDKDELRLVSARSATIEGNNVVLDVTGGHRTSFDVEIAEAYSGPIDLFAYTLTGGQNEN